MSAIGIRPAGRGGAHHISRQGRLTPYLFLLPYAILFGAFILLPAIYGLWISLHNYDFLLPNKPWTGISNYTDLFKSGGRDSSEFWHSMEASGIFTVLSVPFLVVLPLLVAMLLNRKFKGRTFFRALFFAPYVLGVAVVGVLFRYLLDSNLGPVNHYLHALGISRNIPWTTDVPWVWVSLVAVTVWWTLGFNTIIYLAGLQDIPAELVEAATVDGASPWQRFRNVTIPSLRPVLLLITTLTLIASANIFGQAYILTHGQPGIKTRTAIMEIANTGLGGGGGSTGDYRMGVAAAMGYIFMLFLLLISFINFRLFRQKEET
jgi:multiple sugar transport system permease protein